MIKGQIMPLEVKKKISSTMKGKMPKNLDIIRKTFGRNFGNVNGSWKDGRSGNKKYRSWIKNKRNRDKRKNEGHHTFGEWENLKAQYNWTCPCCRKKEPEIKLTEDHRIPVSRGGSENIENIQPLCGSCNSRKATKIIKFDINS